MKRICIIIFVFIAISIDVHAQQNPQDTIYLKNGSTVRGTIIEQVSNKYVKIKTIDNIVFVFQTDEIEKISLKPIPIIQKSLDNPVDKNISDNHSIINSSDNVMSIVSNNSKQFKKGELLIETNIGNIKYTSNSSVIIGYGTNSLGQITINSQLNQHGTDFTISLYPRFGYFIIDNLALGMELDINFYSESNKKYYNTGFRHDDTKYNNSELGFLPFLRYYFGRSKNNKSIFYTQISGGIVQNLSYKYKTQIYNTFGVYTGLNTNYYTKSKSDISANVLAGWSYILSQNIGLNLNLGYKYDRVTYVEKSPNQKITTNNHDIFWGIGFTLLIPTRKSK